jgi:hypothetical protein
MPEKLEMVNHRDNHIGSQAIHYAAACGRRDIIETLRIEFGADVLQITSLGK